MKPTEAQLAERLPVWEALSEFFLDNELGESDYEHIAKVLAVSNYTIEQIENILIEEVCPVCKLNMYSVAGEWIGFNPDWLKEKIGARLGKRSPFRRLSGRLHRWMYAKHWEKVKARILELRAK